MLKTSPLFCLLLFSAVSAQAQNFDIKYSGVAGFYYGVTDTKKENNISNLPNRGVTRTDANIDLNWQLGQNHSLSLKNRLTLVLKEHDKSYSEGDWRFYPHIEDSSKFGTLAAGYMYNAAKKLHKGTTELTIFGVEDSNITYFLSNPNWKNGKSSVAFATPKSTAILNDGRAAKISYFTPQIANTVIGFSYAPDNASRRGMNSRYVDYEKKQDGYTVGMQNKWDLDFAELFTSAGYGIYNRTDKEASFGAALQKNGWSIAIGYKKAYIDGSKNPINTSSEPKQNPYLYDNYRESQAYNISLQYKGERYKSNLSWLGTKADNTRNRDNLLVWSHVYSLEQWLELYVVGAYLDAKGCERNKDVNNRGYALISGIGFRF